MSQNPEEEATTTTAAQADRPATPGQPPAPEPTQQEPAPDPVEAAAAPAKKAPAKRTAKKTVAEPPSGDTEAAPAKKAAKKTARKTAKKAAEPPADTDSTGSGEAAVQAPAKPKRKAAARASKAPVEATDLLFQVPELDSAAGSADGEMSAKPAAKKTATKKATARKSAKKAASAGVEDPAAAAEAPPSDRAGTGAAGGDEPEVAAKDSVAEDGTTRESAEVTPAEGGVKGKGKKKAKAKAAEAGQPDESDTATEASVRSGETRKAKAKKPADAEAAEETEAETSDAGEAAEVGESTAPARRRRRRGGRRRGRKGGEGNAEAAEDDANGDDGAASGDETDNSAESGSRRRRTRNRAPKNPEDEITSVNGSTRLEAKKQRRREGREAGRRRAPIVSEAEFLARRESVERVMVIRQRDDLTQIGVLEDKVLVEHYVSRASQTSMIGNVYLGRVQNVLPSMEAAFIDIGKGRNAVLYAGEVNWNALGHPEGQPRKIESVLNSGQTVLVQVTKDPIGHKGARLTGQISLPGRFLVYVPDGTTSGISRKLPDTERSRLKALLKRIVPDSAGVIVRTAAEGASEEELTRDVERLTARWNDIEAKVRIGQSPQMLYGEPDLTLKVVRDLFTEDFSKLIIEGEDAWELVNGYVSHVAPDLAERVQKFEPDAESGKDIFAVHRVDEQIAKGLDRKVWLPSGGSLIIDRTEAMTVIDVNTGKFTGSGGNLEETVTKNNLEAAEEIVRQLRLRDIGGIIVVDFIDMVLEANRELVLRRLVECLGRDRTRHQVAEVTSLGLVQMTRKRIGTGLLEAFSEPCSHCHGRGVVVHEQPVESAGLSATDDEPRRRGRGGRSRGRNDQARQEPLAPPVPPSPKVLAGTRPHPDADESVPQDETPAGITSPTRPESRPDEGPDAASGAGPDVGPDAGPAVPKSPGPDASSADADTGVRSDSAGPLEEVPAAPAVVVVTTKRRRRSASRPAGPPTLDTPAEASPAASTGSTEPVESAEPVEMEDVGELDDAVDEGPVVHVPIKKKGVRKR